MLDHKHNKYINLTNLQALKAVSHDYVTTIQ